MPFHAKGRGLLRKMDTTSKATTQGGGSGKARPSAADRALPCGLGGSSALPRRDLAGPGRPGFSVRSSDGPLAYLGAGAPPVLSAWPGWGLAHRRGPERAVAVLQGARPAPWGPVFLSIVSNFLVRPASS